MAFDKVPTQPIINSQILKMLECNEICQELKHYSYIDFAFIKFDC